MDENTPENTEPPSFDLWEKAHPHGAPVKDLVAYALEILNFYNPKLLKETK